MSDDITILPRSRIIKVEFEVALPAEATLDQIEEWVLDALQIDGCHDNNPLRSHGFDPIDDPVLTDTKLHLDRTAFDVRKTDTGFSYAVRTKRTLGPIPEDQKLDPSEAFLEKIAGATGAKP